MKERSEIYEYSTFINEMQLDILGHVHNIAYLEILEAARWDAMDRNGYGLPRIQQTQVGPVILDIEITFIRELRNRERVTVKTWYHDFKELVGKVDQILFNERGEEASRARFTYGLLDLKSRKLIPLDDAFFKAFGLTG